MIKGKELMDRLREYGAELGFPIIKATPAQPLHQWEEELARRKELDPDSAGSWEKRGIISDPRTLMAEAKSLVVALRPYKPFPRGSFQGFGTYSAHYKEYPKGREAVRKLVKVLLDEGFQAIEEPLLPVKAAARLSGIGYYGKNGVIHTREYGSWITLHLILTDAELPYDRPKGEISDCGECSLCVKTCPTGAIGDNGAILPSRCLRYYMDGSDFIPLEIRDEMGISMLGCELCQTNCPKNKDILGEAVLPYPGEMEPFELKSILTEWKTGLKARMDRMGEIIGYNYARPRRILSMAVIAAGNTGDRAYIPLLKDTINHPYAPIRAHSAWALGKLNGSDAKSILFEALRIEKEPKVIMEIERALSKKAD